MSAEDTSRPTPVPQETVNAFVGAAHSDLDTVREMLEAEPRLLELRSDQDESALAAASHVGRKPIAEYLLAQGATLDPCAAAMLGRADELGAMLDAGASVDTTGAHGIPLLFHAIVGGNPEIAAELVERGADVDAGAGVQTGLHATVFVNDARTAALLVERGADPEAKGFNGKTVREMAEAMERDEILALF